MPEVLYVTGGRQRSDAFVTDEWFAFDCALVARVEPRTGKITRVVEYTSPPAHRPDARPSVIFKSGDLNGALLTVCTQTEILDVRLPDGTVERALSLPIFNDVHHAIRLESGDYLAAVTGLDMVVQVSPSGDILHEWNTADTPTWERFSRTTDYRKIHTTKPHRSHPNFLFMADGEVWVTRFEQRDAVRADAVHDAIRIGIERPHDGVVQEGRVYFTTVDGHIVIADLARRTVDEIINLNLFADEDVPLGWCRGLAVRGSRAWVGFSRIRATRARENLSWVRHGFRKPDTYRVKPTRVAEYDLDTRELLREIDLETVGLNAVFSVLPASDSGI